MRGPYRDLMEPFEVGAFNLPTFHARLCAALGRHAGDTPFRTDFLELLG